MPTNPSAETIMSTVPSPETVAISTFALSRPAPPPIVVPLFSTTIRLRRSTSLAIHEDLDPKPRFYHPYPQIKRSVPSNAPATASTSSTSPNPNSSSTSFDPEPCSPLTPITEELPTNTDRGLTDRRAEPRMILAPPPSGSLVFSKLDLAEALAKDYRVTLFHSSYIMCCSLSSSSSQKGRFKIWSWIFNIRWLTKIPRPGMQHAYRFVLYFIDQHTLDLIVIQIENQIPHYKVHQDHWGADILLRDQLKSLRDVAAKVAKKGKKKEQSEWLWHQ